MRENEQLMRWLGIEEHPEHKGAFAVHGSFFGWSAELPNFRSSNEWAGALLEKLGQHDIRLDACRLGMEGPVIWSTSDSADCNTWRDAVVDAALEVIRRESVA